MLQIAREELVERANALKLVVLDVDGVLTEGELILIGEDLEAKRFSLYDGMGIIFMRTAGIKVAIISGRISPMVRRRAQELKIDEIGEGFFFKEDGLKMLLEKTGLEPHQAAYVGDDIHDVPAMKLVGLPIAVANARPEVMEYSVYVTSSQGGHGAVREISEWLLDLRGEKEAIFAHYLQTQQEKEESQTGDPEVGVLPSYARTERSA